MVAYQTAIASSFDFGIIFIRVLSGSIICVLSSLESSSSLEVIGDLLDDRFWKDTFDCIHNFFYILAFQII